MRWFFSLKVSKPRCTTRWEGPKKLYRCVYLEGKISLVDSWIIFKITTPFARSFDRNCWNCWSQDLGHLMFQNYCCFLKNSNEKLWTRRIVKRFPFSNYNYAHDFVQPSFWKFSSGRLSSFSIWMFVLLIKATRGEQSNRPKKSVRKLDVQSLILHSQNLFSSTM